MKYVKLTRSSVNCTIQIKFEKWDKLEERENSFPPNAKLTLDLNAKHPVLWSQNFNVFVDSLNVFLNISNVSVKLNVFVNILDVFVQKFKRSNSREG